MVLINQNISSTVLIFSCIDSFLQIYLEDASTVFSVNSGYYPRMPHVQMQHRTQHSWKYFSPIKPNVYVIDCSDHDLENILRSLKFHTFFRPSAVFILIVDFADSVIVDILTKFFIYTFIIFENSTGESRTLYGGDISLNNVSELMEIGYCTNQTVILNSKIILNRKPRTKWSDLNLKIGVGDSPPSAIQESVGGSFQGVDIDIVELISERLQFKPQYGPSENFVGTKRNNTYNGALGMLASKSVDMIMGGMFATGDSSLDFTISSPIHRTTYSWFVPGPTIIPIWDRIMLIYQLSLSIALSWFYVLMALLQFVFDYLMLDLGKKFHFKFFNLWSSMAGIPIKISRREKCSKKLYYICWFLFWVIMNCCFVSKLLECFIKKKYYYPINSLEELTKSKLEVCILEGLQFGLEEYGVKVTTCTFCDECWNRTAFQRDLITVGNSDVVNFYKLRYFIDRNGDPQIHPLKDKYFTTFHVMIFRKNHPVFERFNTILGRMITSGIVAHMRRKYRSWENNNIPTVNKWRSLNMEPLEFIFQFLIYGFFVSILVFVIEIFVSRCNAIV